MNILLSIKQTMNLEEKLLPEKIRQFKRNVGDVEESLRLLHTGVNMSNIGSIYEDDTPFSRHALEDVAPRRILSRIYGQRTMNVNGFDTVNEFFSEEDYWRLNKETSEGLRNLTEEGSSFDDADYIAEFYLENSSFPEDGMPRIQVAVEGEKPYETSVEFFAIGDRAPYNDLVKEFSDVYNQVKEERKQVF